MRTLFMNCSDGPLSYYFGLRNEDIAQPALAGFGAGFGSGLGLGMGRRDTVMPRPEKTPSTQNVLSRREAEVVLMFSRGLSYKEAALAMKISVNTVNDHVKSIYRKLGVNSRSEAVFEAVQLGVVSL